MSPKLYDWDIFSFNFSKTGRPCSYSPKLAACIQMTLSSLEILDFTISKDCFLPSKPRLILSLNHDKTF